MPHHPHPPGPHHPRRGEDIPPHPKPHWNHLDQLSDEGVLKYAPPEIRRLWTKLLQIESSLAMIQTQDEEILTRLPRPSPGATTEE